MTANNAYNAAAASAASSLPTGVVIRWPGKTANIPAGFLQENGQAISRTGANAALFAILGTGFGAGNGSTTFNLRDVGNKYFIGATCDLASGTSCIASTTIEGSAHACGGCNNVSVSISLGSTLVDNNLDASTTNVPCCDSCSFCVCVVPPYTAEFSLIKT